MLVHLAESLFPCHLRLDAATHWWFCDDAGNSLHCFWVNHFTTGFLILPHLFRHPVEQPAPTARPVDPSIQALVIMTQQKPNHCLRIGKQTTQNQKTNTKKPRTKKTNHQKPRTPKNQPPKPGRSGRRAGPVQVRGEARRQGGQLRGGEERPERGPGGAAGRRGEALHREAAGKKRGGRSRGIWGVGGRPNSKPPPVFGRIFMGKVGVVQTPPVLGDCLICLGEGR